MSTHVVMTFQAKPDQVEPALEFLADFQDRSIQAGALTASLMQDEDDPNRILEEEVWQTTDEHKRFLRATAEGTLKPLEGLLFVPYEVHYFDTVKYSRNRQR